MPQVLELGRVQAIGGDADQRATGVADEIAVRPALIRVAHVVKRPPAFVVRSLETNPTHHPQTVFEEFGVAAQISGGDLLLDRLGCVDRCGVGARFVEDEPVGMRIVERLDPREAHPLDGDRVAVCIGKVISRREPIRDEIVIPNEPRIRSTRRTERPALVAAHGFVPRPIEKGAGLEREGKGQIEFAGHVDGRPLPLVVDIRFGTRNTDQRVVIAIVDIDRSP